ncbi:MAG: hybrid sensor histidine kinase/response regulator, partial [Acidiferrobacter sp.]
DVAWVAKVCHEEALAVELQDMPWSPAVHPRLQDGTLDALIMGGETFARLSAGPLVMGLRPILVISEDASTDQVVAAIRWGALDCLEPKDERRLGARLHGLASEQASKNLLNEVFSYMEESLLVARMRPGEGYDILYRNPACARRMGQHGPASGDRLLSLSPGPRTDMRKLDEIRHEMKAGHPVRAELIDYRPDGETLWTEFSATPLTNPEYWIAVSRDVTRRHESEDSAQRLRELVIRSQKHENTAVLAAGIAHDFNNILTGIVGSAELARMALPPEHAVQADIETIITASQRAAELNRELLDFAGPGKGSRDAVYLNSMVTTMLVILRSQMQKSIVVRKALRPDVPPIEADPSEIQQVMLNLCLNASEAMAERGGTLSITTDRMDIQDGDRAGFAYGWPQVGTYAVFEVTDTGRGMEPALKERAFEPFFSSKESARGIGLSVVLSIVKAYRGGIDIDTAPGHGTTIRVFLPAAPARERRSPTTLQRQVSAEHRTILFVDDEEMLRSLAQRALEPLGYRMLVAPDGVEGVRIFRENMAHIDLVILDLSMPRMGGEDAFKEMQVLNARIPILLCCGYDEASAQQKTGGSRFAGYLSKPFGVGTLIDAVRGVLSKTDS